MKQFTRAVVSAALCAALSLACTLPAYAAEGEMLEVNEDISVSVDYDWTRFANDHLTLNVYNWGLYISDGSDDSVNVISAFEDLTGIKVNYTTFDSNESLYAKMKSGGASYDVIVPSDYMVGKMIAENMLAELDYDNIPNMANIGENYLGWSYDPDNTYSVPYMMKIRRSGLATSGYWLTQKAMRQSRVLMSVLQERTSTLRILYNLFFIKSVPVSCRYGFFVSAKKSLP